MEWTTAERQALAAEIAATTGLALATVQRVFLSSRMADLDQFIADWDGASAAVEENLAAQDADLDQFIADWDGASAAARMEGAYHDESPGDRSG